VQVPAARGPAEREPAAEVAVSRGGTVTAIDFGSPAPSSSSSPSASSSSSSDPDDPRLVQDIDNDWANGHSADLPKLKHRRAGRRVADGDHDGDVHGDGDGDRDGDGGADADADADETDAPARRPRALVGRRPFDLIPALILTGILTGFLVLAAFAERVLGSGAAVATISAAGLADSHAGALTAANLAAQGTLTTETAVLAAMAALAANTVVKLILAHVAGGRRASTTLAALFAGPMLAVVLGLFITLGISA
jgi:hypothetical protein